MIAVRVLVFNSGSSSLKCGVFDAGKTLIERFRGTVTGFGEDALLVWTMAGERGEEPITAPNHAEAVAAIFTELTRRSLLEGVAAIGHRIVHGGDRFSKPVHITDTVLTQLESINVLAPLHNPPALTVVRACRVRFKTEPMIAVFDTAYFRALPDYVSTYALPREWLTAKYRIRRYGFHGIAHRCLVERYHVISGADQTSSRVISLQLGHGCSITAVRGGQPLETSMGFTPLEGLIMATRPGDVDAGVLLNLIDSLGVTTRELRDGLNLRSGLLGLSGVSADMRQLLELELKGHAGAKLAVEAFCHRARKYVGAYLAVLGGADAIIFGGGIGEHAIEIRSRICAGMEWCGLAMDRHANQATVGMEGRITELGSHVQAYVIPVDEESLIAQDTVNCL
tara:strand:- start:2598 stop:3785 length:1188 start_codon:yes stop_codon:yes gene_type:complete